VWSRKLQSDRAACGTGKPHCQSRRMPKPASRASAQGLCCLCAPQVFSGDVDGIVPLAGTRRWIASLGLGVKEGWRPWYTQSGTTFARSAGSSQG
jgi:Serine carboxypeptidase